MLMLSFWLELTQEQKLQFSMQEFLKQLIKVEQKFMLLEAQPILLIPMSI